MANLNFQQPPRSIANQGLSRGFGSSSLSGHVTPTSGMFPGSGSSFSTPQQLSPNRNIMANRALFGGQRSFPERRQVLGSVMQDWSSSGMNSVAAAGFGGMGGGGRSSGANSYTSASSQLANFHSVFAGGDATTPPLLDPSEFPSLTNRGDSMPQPSASMPGKQPYVGMVKQPTAESSEFTMSSEDFPALPGTGGGSSSGEGVVVGGLHGAVGSEKAERGGSNSVSPPPVIPPPPDGPIQVPQPPSIPASTALTAPTSTSTRTPGTEKHSQKRGIQTSPDGKVTNIPNSMVKDQFGMVGLLTFIRAAETDPNLVSLALGQDLTALGLNLNSPDNLYPTFGGPWAEHPCRAQDIDYHVPPEYIINHSIKDKLAQVKLTRYKDDLLFFMFYTSVGDMLQLAAANELYLREWRYHMEEKVWLTQAPGCGVIEKTSTYERGTYYFFDAQNWRKVAKEFHLDYSKLENQPSMPSALSPFHST